MTHARIDFAIVLGAYPDGGDPIQIAEPASVTRCVRGGSEVDRVLARHRLLAC